MNVYRLLRASANAMYLITLNVRPLNASGIISISQHGNGKFLRACGIIAMANQTECPYDIYIFGRILL